MIEDSGELLIKMGWAIWSFFQTSSLLSYANILGALGIALIIAVIAGERKINALLAFLFPKEIWQSPSAKLDVIFYLIIEPLKVFIIGAFLLAFMQVLSYEVVAVLEALFGPRHVDAQAENGLFAMLAYTFIVFMAKDFAFFYSHRLQHKWPLLWCFHKVHHSAPVLTPFTAMRFHPVDLLWNMGWGIGLTLLASALCQYFFYNGKNELMLLGNNIIIALSFVTTHHFRHSHIWVNYPKWLARWLISPAMHQLHHSAEPRHWDRNVGYLFAGWDRWFGSSYYPKEKEQFRLGVYENEQLYQRHNSIFSLFWVPFVEAAALTRAALAKADSKTTDVEAEKH